MSSWRLFLSLVAIGSVAMNAALLIQGVRWRQYLTMPATLFLYTGASIVSCSIIAYYRLSSVVSHAPFGSRDITGLPAPVLFGIAAYLGLRLLARSAGESFVQANLDPESDDPRVVDLHPPLVTRKPA